MNREEHKLKQILKANKNLPKITDFHSYKSLSNKTWP